MTATIDLKMSVKNTFLDFEEPARDSGSRRRPRSTPPAAGRGRGRPDEDEDHEAVAAQLARLDAVLREPGSVVATAKLEASPTTTTTTTATTSAAGSLPSSADVGNPKFFWASAGSDTDEETPRAATAAAYGMGNTGSIAGGLPSVGSAAHALGTCRPCAFARSSSGCKFGVACGFCHFVGEHAEPVRMRPCKGKRERFKRAMSTIQERVAENPDLLYRGELELPAFVDKNPQAKARVMAQLAQVAADAYRRMGDAPAPVCQRQAAAATP